MHALNTSTIAERGKIKLKRDKKKKIPQNRFEVVNHDLRFKTMLIDMIRMI